MGYVTANDTEKSLKPDAGVNPLMGTGSSVL